jgi:hypothetical protein
MILCDSHCRCQNPHSMAEDQLRECFFFSRLRSHHEGSLIQTAFTTDLHANRSDRIHIGLLGNGAWQQDVGLYEIRLALRRDKSLEDDGSLRKAQRTLITRG